MGGGGSVAVDGLLAIGFRGLPLITRSSTPPSLFSSSSFLVFYYSQGYSLFFSHFSLSFTFWSFSFASLIQATPVNTNDPIGWHIMQILFKIVNVPFTNRNRYHRGISNIAIARDNGSYSWCKNSFVNATCKKVEVASKST